MRQWTVRCGLMFLGFLAAGCVDTSGGKKIPNLVPVSGTVKLDGTPVEQGTISFAPENPNGQPASGQIKGGKYTMLTTVSAPGVVAGDYKVRVAGVDKTPSAPTDAKKPNSETIGGIPKKYDDVNTSELKASVKAGMGPLDFDLKSK